MISVKTTRPIAWNLFRISVSLVVGGTIAHIPLLFFFLLLSLLKIDSSSSGFYMVVPAIGIGIVAGIGFFGWVYRRLGHARPT